MATQTTMTNRSEPIERMAMRWIAIALLAFIALGATMDSVGAQPSPGSYQNGFTGACRKHGGTPKRVGSRIVKCTLGDGTTITCDFNVDPPACTTKAAALASVNHQDVLIDAGIVTVAVEDAGPSVPETRATTGRVSQTQIVVATDDDQR